VINTYKRLPADPADWFSPDEVAKAREYQRPLARARVLDGIISTAVLAAILLTHAVPRYLDAVGVGWWPAQVVLTLLFLLVVSTVFDLPMALWRTFVHEQRWGFNTQTPKGFVVDLVKGLVLNLVIMSVLLTAIWALIRATDMWWLWGWGVVFVFSVGLGMLYPILIAPIFNRFTPLEDPELVGRLRALADRAKLAISEVLVMDASKRTRKDNAYFAGLGKTRRVVLFDNLLEQPPEAVEVVVAHEMGHWRRKHISRNLPLGAALTLAMFLFVRWLVTWEPALDLAGVGSVREPAAIPLFLAAFVPFNLLVGLVQAWFSRACERQADLEALELTGDPEAYREMQRGLHTKNLADLAPGTWKYLRLSHPPAAERLELSKIWERERSAVR